MLQQPGTVTLRHASGVLVICSHAASTAFVSTFPCSLLWSHYQHAFLPPSSGRCVSQAGLLTLA